MGSELLAEAQSLAPALVSWRRHLHAHPELSGREERTAAFLAAQARQLGLSPVPVAGLHGFYVDLPTSASGPRVALRADIDALPIVEDTGVEYASQNPGVMHACGHDAHAAMLLGAAQLLLKHREQLRRPVRLIFQPHEELYPGGAPAMIAGGALEGVGAIFGIHISSSLPIGDIGTRPGAFMAAVNPIAARIVGRGGHAAMPDLSIDPIVAAAHAITALQTIVSRSVPITEPVVVTITTIHGGTADNVIPQAVELGGTLRTFSPAMRELCTRRVREVLEQTAAAHGARAEVAVRPGYPVLVNDAALTEQAFAAARAIGFDGPRAQTLAPLGGGEDFAYYCEKVPGVFVFLGAANEAKGCTFPHHHPRFNVDEDALAAGAALHAQFALAAGA